MDAGTFKGKPLLRGHFHQAAFFFALGACSILISVANNPTARTASIIYGLCLSALFGISSLYHRITWPELPRMWFRRLDHAMIFVFIAGTATPICLLGLTPDVGHKLLWIFWICAGAGLFKELVWFRAPRWVSAVFYVIMGWLAVPYLSEFFSALGPQNTWLMIAGGLIYTVGAVIYAVKRPNPFPRTFGYHEIFHILVMVASIFHFIVIYRLIRA